MSTIQFKEVNCKNCYKCVRTCPVKAISLKNDHAQVIEDSCVFCGRCLQVCPQNAKSVKNDVEKVKTFIGKKQKMYASIAPSFMAAFNLQDIRQAYSMFKSLGFTYVEETAVGAAVVSAEYKRLLEKADMKNILTTACPSVAALIEKHYPELINQMAPVVSPMVAHGKMLKELYGSRIKVVFIGPCLSKKQECKELEEEIIDAVITYEELENWMKEENISFDSIGEAEAKNIHFNYNARYYPAPGGIIKSLGTIKKHNYKFMKFDGIDRCIEVLEQIKEGKVMDYFIEMNSCRGACLGGSCMNSENPGYLILRERLLDYVGRSSISQSLTNTYSTRVDLKKTFKDKSMSYIIPDDGIIADILSKIGKFTKEQELNCGACGYTTCRDKAIAVYNKKAELHMCVPYMREKAESMSNVILNSTPNAIFAVTEELTVQEANLAARKLFKLECEELQNRNIFEILDCIDIITVNDTKQNILNKKYTYLKYNIVVEQSILYVKENHMLIIVMKDITQEEKQKEKLHKVRSETVDIAQKVIDKQMRVAQEIASLLGETTAETKVALTKLKNSIQAEMREEI